MKITEAEVLYVARLARLDLDQVSIERFADQIGNILEYVDALKKVPTEGVSTTSHAINLTNVLREDAPAAHLDRDRATQNAPEEEDGSFVVPKVI